MEYVTFGIITGSILAVGTVGLALVRQIDGFINIAHGQFLALGAFVGLYLAERLGSNVFAVGILVFVIMGWVGVAVSRTTFQPIKEKGPLALLFTSVGVSLVLYAVIISVFGAQIYAFPISLGRNIGSLPITSGEITIVVLAWLTIFGLYVFLSYTELGRWVRATASNPQLARIRGARVQFISTTVWFVAGGLAGMAGVLLGVTSSVHAELGWNWILLILAAAILGGLGSVWGVIAASFVLGLAMDVSALIIPTSYRSGVAFGTLIVALLWRPEGIFTLDRSSKKKVALWSG